MAEYLGVDWASKGWFAITIDDAGGWAMDLYPSIWSLWANNRTADQILIDIPIGLPSDGRRTCDVQAKQTLTHAHRSVFYTPLREAVYETNLDDAKALNERAGYSIQNQAWSIVPRIREVDEFLDSYPNASDRLQETHPELCFYGFNAETPLADPKTTDAGIARRRELLADAHPEAPQIYEHAVEQFMTPSYAPLVSAVDDILDALAAAITAVRHPEDTSTLPVDPPTDDRGLPMQMVYPSATEQTTLSALDSHT